MQRDQSARARSTIGDSSSYKGVPSAKKNDKTSGLAWGRALLDPLTARLKLYNHAERCNLVRVHLTLLGRPLAPGSSPEHPLAAVFLLEAGLNSSNKECCMHRQPLAGHYRPIVDSTQPYFGERQPLPAVGVIEIAASSCIGA